MRSDTFNSEGSSVSEYDGCIISDKKITAYSECSCIKRQRGGGREDHASLHCRHGIGEYSNLRYYE